MKKIWMGLTLLVSAFGISCNEQDTPVFSEQRLIYIDYPESNTNKVFNCSFISTKENQLGVDVPLRYAGRVLTQDAAFSISVDLKQTTLEASEYVLPESYVFPKGGYRNTVTVLFNRTERMRDGSFVLVLNLRSNDTFRADVRDLISARITVTDQIDDNPPAWWDADVIANLLGEYSKTKFRILLTEIYSGDYGALSADDKRNYALDMKGYIEKYHPVDEETGKPIEVPVIG